MNPSLVIIIAAIAATLGGVGYSYHEGRNQGKAICEATILEAKLKQKEEELDISNQLTEFQQKQISEAQDQLTAETDKNAHLKLDLEKALAGKPLGCITPGMRDAIAKFRLKGKRSNP